MSSQPLTTPREAPTMPPPVAPGPPETVPSAAKRRRKLLFQTTTFRVAVLMVLAYLGAKVFEAPAEVTQAIVVVGVALIAISMRWALAQHQREVLRLREALEQARQGIEPRPAEPPRHTKPLYRSMTVLCALLTAAAYFVARHYGAPDVVTNTIALVGITASAIYLRRAMIEIWDED
jgi:small neutral amino acid transporter SnatA (MarC family)